VQRKFATFDKTISMSIKTKRGLYFFANLLYS